MDIQEYIISGKIEMYVTGLCSPAEEQEMEQLRRQYPELDKAIVAYELELENTLLKQRIQPGHETDEQILQWFETQKSPARMLPVTVQKNKWLKYAAAAAIVLLLGSGIVNFYQYRHAKKLQGEITSLQERPPASLPEKDYQVMKNPDITPVAMYGVGLHAICRCTMFWDKKTGKLYIMIHHLPQSSTSRDYQLWAMVDGKVISVGIVEDSIRGRFIEMGNVPAGATSFIVTLEQAGGNSLPTIAETYLEGRI